jgi:hypothetical protein
MNKRGEAQEGTWMFAVMLIVGLALAFVIVGVGVQYYLFTIDTAEDFDILVETLESLNDGDSKTILYKIDGVSNLVGFNGEDIGPESLWHCPSGVDHALDLDGIYFAKSSIVKPSSCEGEACICHCSASFYQQQMSYDACTKSKYCKSLDLVEDATLITPSCEYGAVVAGRDSGILNLFLEREGDVYRICTTENCVDSKDEEVIEGLKKELVTYKSCLSKDSCACEMDPSFLTEDYAIQFYSDKVELYSLSSEKVVYTDEFETKFALDSRSNEVVNILKATKLVGDITEYNEVSIGGKTSGVDIQNVPILIQSSFVDGSNHKEILFTVLKNEEVMVFADATFDPSSQIACSSLEDKSKIFS